MFTQISIATLLASLAAAQIHVPIYKGGNSIISPPTMVVPACQPYTITWTPSTPNTVSLILLHGASASTLTKYGASLAEGIANSGSLVWTPPATLPSSTGATGYGIQLIDDVTGEYQYSQAFGISTAGCAAVSSSSVASSQAAAASSSVYGYGASSAVVSSTKASSTAAGYPGVAPYPTTVAAPKSTLIYSTGVPAGNATVLQPTRPITVPGSLAAPSATGNATTVTLPQATGAASALQAGAGLVGAVAALAAFML